MSQQTLYTLNSEMMNHKYYYTYKITLLKGSLKDHYYFGQHRTNDLNDKYCGSGRVIKDYYKKYGRKEGDSYIKEILCFYDSPDDLNKAEDELIGEKWKTDQMCLNITRGGVREHFETTTEVTKQKLREATKRYFENCTDFSPYQKFKGCHHTEETKRKISEHHRTNYHPLSEETKNKIRNSSKGRHWRTDPETGRRIFYKDE